MKKESTTVQTVSSRRRNRRNRRRATNGIHARLWAYLLAGDEEPDVQISIHPDTMRRLIVLGASSTRPISPALILDEMIYYAMEQGPYGVPVID